MNQSILDQEGYTGPMTTITDIMEMKSSGKTLFARNETASTVTCNTKDISFQLSPKGTSGSVGILPEAALGVRGFQKMCMDGLVTVSHDPALIEQYAKQGEEQEARRREEIENLSAAVQEEDSKNDLVPMTCLVSGKPVFQTQREVREKIPPLAPKFKHMASDFRVETVMKDGKPDTMFVRR